MNYCKKCARIVESDLDVCPYCGNSEAELEGLEGAKITLGDSQEERANSHEVNTYEADDFEEPEIYSPSEIYIEPEAHAVPAEVTNDSRRPPNPEEPSGDIPIYHETVKDFIPEKEVDPALKVIMTIITVLFPYAGLIVAIIFMNSSSTSYKSTGKLLLIISLIELAIGILCCCGAIALIAAAA